ncbi:hypothetical protein KDL45_08065, partial [bacterium]|nr:hypothetical protein [bacterium]
REGVNFSESAHFREDVRPRESVAPDPVTFPHRFLIVSSSFPHRLPSRADGDISSSLLARIPTTR